MGKQEAIAVVRIPIQIRSEPVIFWPDPTNGYISYFIYVYICLYMFIYFYIFLYIFIYYYIFLYIIIYFYVFLYIFIYF